jgi:branched-chain amino acid transport system substrate-binding protein
MRERRTTSTSVRRRRFLRAAGATGVAGLAGCQSLGQETPARGGSGQSTPNGTTTGSATVEPFTVGVLKTDFGSDVLRSAKIAVDELNASGRINGKVKVVAASGSASPKGEEKAYRKVVSKGADVTIGGLYPRGYLQAMAEKKKIHITSVSPWPLPARLISRQVSPVEGNPEQEYEQFKYFFRAGPLNLIDLQKAQVQLVENYASQLGWERIGIVVENLNIGADKRVKALQKAASKVVEVPVAEVVSGSINDWTPIFDKLENANVDLAAVFLVISAVVANKQWADQQRSFQMGGIHLPAMQKSYWNEVNGAADSLWTMNAATPLSSNTPQTQPFLKEYAKRHGGTPAYVGPLSYDAVKVYAHAIEQVGSSDPEKLIPFLEEDCAFTGGTFVPELGFRGPDAEFAHDPAWTSIEKSGVPVFQQWQPADGGGGRMEVFAPKKNKTADYIKPPWQR